MWVRAKEGRWRLPCRPQREQPAGVMDRRGWTIVGWREHIEGEDSVMRVAIYARKSTDQHHVSEAQKSVSRQVDQARRYATQKGWAAADAHIYVDDGVSGAEFATRPGFLRLMNALKPRPDFHVLVMSEESRLGREAIETAYALKQIITSGVRVFFYLDQTQSLRPSRGCFGVIPGPVSPWPFWRWGRHRRRGFSPGSAFLALGDSAERSTPGRFPQPVLVRRGTSTERGACPQ